MLLTICHYTKLDLAALLTIPSINMDISYRLHLLCLISSLDRSLVSPSLASTSLSVYDLLCDPLYVTMPSSSAHHNPGILYTADLSIPLNADYIRSPLQDYSNNLIRISLIARIASLCLSYGMVLLTPSLSLTEYC